MGLAVPVVARAQQRHIRLRLVEPVDVPAARRRHECGRVVTALDPVVAPIPAEGGGVVPPQPVSTSGTSLSRLSPCSASAMGWVVKPLRLARSRASRLISIELET